MALEDATNPMQGVSGPGKFAKRTDLEYQSTGYGDGVAYDAAKGGAPLARAQKNPMLSQAPQVSSAAPLPGLYDPTQRPDEPVTAGIDRGDGVGSDALMMRQPDDAEFRASIAAYMPVLAYIAGRPDASPETRAAIRQLRDYA
jgi:hypothetical protein